MRTKQLGDFGIIAGEDAVTGGHSCIGGNHAVIQAGDGDAGPANQEPSASEWVNEYTPNNQRNPRDRSRAKNKKV